MGDGYGHRNKPARKPTPLQDEISLSPKFPFLSELSVAYHKGVKTRYLAEKIGRQIKQLKDDLLAAAKEEVTHFTTYFCEERRDDFISADYIHAIRELGLNVEVFSNRIEVSWELEGVEFKS